jgi:hypothetical protein
MFNFISQKLQGAAQEQALQALANYLGSNKLQDSNSESVLNLLKTLKGIEPKLKQLKLSNTTGTAITKSINLNDIKLGFSQNELDFINKYGVQFKPETNNQYLGAYSTADNTMYLNLKELGELKGTVLHELGHAIEDNVLNSELKTQFETAVFEPSKELTYEGRYILTKRALSISGTDGDIIQKYVLGLISETELPARLRFTANNLYFYYRDQSELFAEGYMMFRNDPNFKEMAPNLYNLYNNLYINLMI